MMGLGLHLPQDLLEKTMELKFNHREKEIVLQDKERQSARVFPTLQEAVDKVGLGYGADFIVITEEQWEQMENGAVLGFDNGEYSTFILVEKKTDNGNT